MSGNCPKCGAVVNCEVVVFTERGQTVTQTRYLCGPCGRPAERTATPLPEAEEPRKSGPAKDKTRPFNTCPACSTEFQTPYSRPDAVYCSRACYKSTWTAKKAAKAAKSCEWCKKLITGAGKRFCSVRCRALGRSGEAPPGNLREAIDQTTIDGPMVAPPPRGGRHAA